MTNGKEESDNRPNCGMEQGLGQNVDALQDKLGQHRAKEDADYTYTCGQWGTAGKSQESGSTIRQVTHKERMCAENKSYFSK